MEWSEGYNVIRKLQGRKKCILYVTIYLRADMNVYTLTFFTKKDKLFKTKRLSRWKGKETE